MTYLSIFNLQIQTRKLLIKLCYLLIASCLIVLLSVRLSVAWLSRYLRNPSQALDFLGEIPLVRLCCLTKQKVKINLDFKCLAFK